MPSNLSDYEILETIGTGSYGICRKVRRKRDNKVLVWKELQYGMMSEEEKQLLVSEVNLLRELRHQHIVHYYDRIIDRTNTTLYIVMEYCEGGDLASLIMQSRKDGKRLDEEFVWRIAAQIVSALQECHSRQKNGRAVLHRDLKPANIFLDGKGNVKLGDFGLARVLSHDNSFANTFVGTPYYMSPEQINHMSYNAKSDIWSLGCLLYELCNLHPPFLAANQHELAIKIRYGKFSHLPTNYSEELNSFVINLLQVDERKRPDVEELSHHTKLMTLLPTDNRKSSPENTKSKNMDLSPAVFAQREEMLSAREESVQCREDAVTVREQEVKRKERLIQAREKELTLKEEVLEQKMKRIERAVKMVNCEPRISDGNHGFPMRLANCVQDIIGQFPRGCLMQNSPVRESSKKRVTFTSEKENIHDGKNGIRARTASIVRLVDRPLPTRRSSTSADLLVPSNKDDDKTKQNCTGLTSVLR